MKGKFRLLIKDQFTRLSLILSLLFLIPSIAIIFYTYGNLPPLLPFYNSMPWGEDRLLSSNLVLVFPLLLLLVFLINVIQSAFFYSKYVLIARIFMINTFLFLALGLLAYLQILFLTF